MVSRTVLSFMTFVNAAPQLGTMVAPLRTVVVSWRRLLDVGLNLDCFVAPLTDYLSLLGLDEVTYENDLVTNSVKSVTVVRVPLSSCSLEVCLWWTLHSSLGPQCRMM